MYTQSYKNCKKRWEKNIDGRGNCKKERFKLILDQLYFKIEL